ncbi:MAG: hypothetical protein ACYC3A_10360 [Halothiobacillus sp.]
MNLIKPTILAAAVSTALMLTACGGGGSSSPSASVAAASTTINGSVVDGPISGANVCLYANGSEVLSGSSPVCATTDANGNYALSIPGGGVKSADYLNLITTKGSAIKLASAVGTMQDLLNAAKNNVVSAADLPAVQVTNLTSAQFALVAGTDGFVDETEAQGITKEKQQDVGVISTLIKSYIDGGEHTRDLHGSTDTLAMADDAASGLANNKNLKDGESPDTGASNYLNAQLTTWVTGKTFVINDSSGTNIVTFAQGSTPNTGPVTIVGGNPPIRDTGTWTLDTAQTPPVITISGTQHTNSTIQVLGLGDSADSGVSSIYVQFSTVTYPETLRAVIPFVTADISGKTVTYNNNSVSFNADGTGLDHSACSSNGAIISSWSVTQTGALLADETSSCTGDMRYAYLLERDDNALKFAGYTIKPATNTVDGTVTAHTYTVTTP